MIGFTGLKNVELEFTSEHMSKKSLEKVGRAVAKLDICFRVGRLEVCAGPPLEWDRRKTEVHVELKRELRESIRHERVM